jgi:hypothetical protein
MKDPLVNLVFINIKYFFSSPDLNTWLITYTPQTINAITILPTSTIPLIVYGLK